MDCAYSCSCGSLSTACQQYFMQEACFYECDHNIGLFRQFRSVGADSVTGNCMDGTGSQNAWQILNLPLKPSLVNGWWAACKNDLFCTAESGSYFDLPSSACVAPVAPAEETIF